MRFVILLVVMSLVSNTQNYPDSIPGFTDSTKFPDSDYEKVDLSKFLKQGMLKKKVDPQNLDLHLLNAAVFYATNEARVKKKQKMLSFNEALRNAAQVHAYEMVIHDFFNHVNSKSKDWKTLKDRVDAFSFSGSRIAENIAKGFMDKDNPKTYLELGREAVEMWMNSKQHKKTMLDHNFDYMACAIYFYPEPDGQYYWYTAVQTFGKDWD